MIEPSNSKSQQDVCALIFFWAPHFTQVLINAFLQTIQTEDGTNAPSHKSQTNKTFFARLLPLTIRLSSILAGLGSAWSNGEWDLAGF